MNWYSVLQSIVTWLLTSFALSCVVWAAKTSKRITVLEEHDKVQIESISKLDEVLKNQEKLSTKMDLLLEGKIKLRRSRKDED
jgi:uncharacterized coiled-coil protein SlyX